jgi:hypothetical protein
LTKETQQNLKMLGNAIAPPNLQLSLILISIIHDSNIRFY